MELTRIGYHHFIFQTIDEFLEKREGANIRDLDELHAYWKAHPWENLLDLEVTTYLRKDGRQEHHTFILYSNGDGDGPVFSTEKLLSICRELNYPEDKMPKYFK